MRSASTRIATGKPASDCAVASWTRCGKRCSNPIPHDACCRACTASQRLETAVGSLPLEGLLCQGNECSIEASCELPVDEDVVVWGIPRLDASGVVALEYAGHCAIGS